MASAGLSVYNKRLVLDFEYLAPPPPKKTTKQKNKAQILDV